MSLLKEIQSLIIQGDTELNSIFLKLRYLAAKLGSNPLEEWIKHESEGYPIGSDVPAYRIVSVTYRGTFSSPYREPIQNAPIPTALIKKLGGEEWVNWKIHMSIAEIDDIVKSDTHTDSGLEIDASNLILVLQGRIYENFACHEVRGTISETELVGIQNIIRNRILDFTLRLEKSTPVATEITLDSPEISNPINSGQATNLYHQTILGDFKGVNIQSGSGKDAQISLTIGKGDDKALSESLVKAGIPQSDASELAKIIKSDEPGNSEEPLGPATQNWLAKNIQKAASGMWGIGVSVATKVVTDLALKYYDLK